MRRRTISVPLTRSAMDQLDLGDCPFEMLKVMNLSEADFKTLFDLNFFLELSQALDAWVDDYEEDEIIGTDKLARGKQICAEFGEEHPDMEILSNIQGLFELALEKETCVSFDF